MKRTLLMLAMLALAACNTPARIPAPDSDTVDSGKRALEELARLPPAMERVRVGDTLRIVRDAGEMPTLSAFNVATIYELTLYTVLNDGSIYYPFIGRIQAAHRTPQEIANELTTKLAPIYREPRVTVNINQAPGNTVFVGGAVRNPSAVPIPAANNMEQAILGAGGILPVGDSSELELWRRASGRYQRSAAHYSSRSAAPIVERHPRREFPILRFCEPPVEGDASFINPSEFHYDGIAPEQRGELLASLRRCLYHPQAHYAHRWRSDDLVIADNLTLLHGREAFVHRAPRHLRRVHIHAEPALRNPHLQRD
ncbi:TPA: TauD/TfdA family dioxygenase [Pseudomonas aeruginosa]